MHLVRLSKNPYTAIHKSGEYEGENMKLMRNQRGMTLIELIIAIAILGIISVTFLNMFGSGYTHIFRAGNRTKTIAELQAIIDKSHTQEFVDAAAIETYFNGNPDGRIFNKVANIGDIDTKIAGKDVNYHIGALETIVNSGTNVVDGYQVTIALFFNNGKDAVKVTTFVIKGGS